MALQVVQTETLEIGYDIGGPDNGEPVLLLHGWPDDIRAWRDVAPILQDLGYRTLAPYLRGCGPTRFLSEETPRDGRAVALARDAIDLANVLGLESFAVVGHDWGARAAYTLAALAPERVRSVVALALGYQPNGAFSVSTFEQARLFWYQWFMAVDRGAEAVRNQPVAFARLQWETWSPPGWFTDEEFALTAQSFANPDWAAVTLSAYRTRWRADETVDPRYEELQQRLQTVDKIDRPTLLIHGADDFCNLPASVAGQEDFFSGPYRQVLLPGVGHFPSRENPLEVAKEIGAHLAED